MNSIDWLRYSSISDFWILNFGKRIFFKKKKAWYHGLIDLFFCHSSLKLHFPNLTVLAFSSSGSRRWRRSTPLSTAPSFTSLDPASALLSNSFLYFFFAIFLFAIFLFCETYYISAVFFSKFSRFFVFQSSAVLHSFLKQFWCYEYVLWIWICTVNIINPVCSPVYADGIRHTVSTILHSIYLTSPHSRAPPRHPQHSILHSIQYLTSPHSRAPRDERRGHSMISCTVSTSPLRIPVHPATRYDILHSIHLTCPHSPERRSDGRGRWRHLRQTHRRPWATSNRTPSSNSAAGQSGGCPGGKGTREAKRTAY
jgi:hypothetical protein